MKAMGRSKAELRAHFREQRQQALQADPAGLEAAVLRVAAALERREGRVGIYWPLPGELDLRHLAEGAAVALPAIDAGKLVYRPWQPGDPLSPDACGIPAPPAAAGELTAQQMALLLIPALAVDRRGFRLGYGGGWYDRLRQQEIWRTPRTLAVLPAACCTAELPNDPWDVPLDGWINEHGLQGQP